MKTVRFTAECRDKFDFSHVFRIGEEVSFDDDRADDVVGRGLAVMANSVPAKNMKKAEETKEVQEIKKSTKKKAKVSDDQP